jgi:hypothetical protein
LELAAHAASVSGSTDPNATLNGIDDGENVLFESKELGFSWHAFACG